LQNLEDGVSINGVWEHFTENIKISAKLSLPYKEQKQPTALFDEKFRYLELR